MSNMLRKLRIAFSVVCGIVCLSLIALWVRSYWWLDSIYGTPPNNYAVSLYTAYGRIAFAAFDRTYDAAFTGYRVTGWHVGTSRIDRPPTFQLVNTPLTNFGLGFAGSRDRYGMVVVIPLWFLTMLLSIASIVPWMNTYRRFSLRTLLIATTLIAVLLGLIVIAIK
jgi:hypothetical protein